MTRDQAQQLIALFSRRDDILRQIEKYKEWGGAIIIYAGYESQFETVEITDAGPDILDILEDTLTFVNNKIKDAGGTP